MTWVVSSETATNETPTTEEHTVWIGLENSQKRPEFCHILLPMLHRHILLRLRGQYFVSFSELLHPFTKRVDHVICAVFPSQTLAISYLTASVGGRLSSAAATIAYEGRGEGQLAGRQVGQSGCRMGTKNWWWCRHCDEVTPRPGCGGGRQWHKPWARVVYKHTPETLRDDNGHSWSILHQTCGCLFTTVYRLPHAVIHKRLVARRW